jgi:serine protease 16
MDMAMEDVVYFTEFIRKMDRAAPNLRFYVVGGSYTGSLTSYFRMKYPHIAQASWSSSAPLNIKNDFKEYDEYVANQLKKVSVECFEHTKQLFDEAEAIIVGGDKAKKDKLKTELMLSVDTDDISTLYILVDVLCAWVQYDANYKLMKGYCEAQKEKPNWNEFLVTYKKYFDITKQSPARFDLLARTSERSKRSLSQWACMAVPSLHRSWLASNSIWWFQIKIG